MTFSHLFRIIRQILRRSEGRTDGKVLHEMEMMRRLLAGFAGLFAFAEGQQPTYADLGIPDGVWPHVKLPEGARILRDLEVARTPQKTLLLDLYLPANAPGPIPLVVWIHGGGWAEGDRRNACPYHLVGQGYAMASIMYRFSQEAIFPAQLYDCKAAIRWLRAHAHEYGIDPDRIGAWGGSAGGHLASLLGTTGGRFDLEGDVGGNLEQSSRVQAVCDYCGPSNLLWFDAEDHRRVYGSTMPYLDGLVGGSLGENREVALQASPITHIRGGEPPFLAVYGDVDTLIPPVQGEMLVEALREAGSDATLKIVEKGWHVFWGAEIDRLVLDFFDNHLKSRQ